MRAHTFNDMADEAPFTHVHTFTFTHSDSHIHIHTWLEDSHMAEDACEDG